MSRFNERRPELALLYYELGLLEASDFNEIINKGFNRQLHGK